MVRKWQFHIKITLLFVTIVFSSNCSSYSFDEHPRHESISKNIEYDAKGALLLSRFQTLADLKSVIEIEYYQCTNLWNCIFKSKPRVYLSHHGEQKSIASELKTGVSESDFLRAQDGGIWEKIKLVFKSPYAVWNRYDLRRLFALSRRRGATFGEGDVAFFDIASRMVEHIDKEDKQQMESHALSEKGYLNTFNHLTAQALMTSIFSEELADFIADTHERRYHPNLITGIFDDKELNDRDQGATDNYVDIINNEWGQELGKMLRDKYELSKETKWNEQLLTNYLNEIQMYCSWAFEIGFQPFQSTDDLIIRFTKKLNDVMEVVPLVR